MRGLSATITAILLVLSFASAAHAFAIGSGDVIAPASPGGTYVEVGDAGGHLSPQAIVGVDISTITGNVGDAGDPSDAFRFFFAGGGIAFVGTATFPPTGDLIPLPLSLFPDLGYPPDPVKPDFEDLAGSVIAFSALAGGNYIIEGTYLTDPPFTIQVFTLNPDGTPGTTLQVLQPPTAVTAPAGALLLALGFVGLWRAGRLLRRH